MITNLSALMNLIAQKESDYSNVLYALNSKMYNTTVQELDGRTNIIEDNFQEFNEDLAECEKLSKEITLLKGVLYEKNNSLKLSDGRSIQTAIVENSNLRKLKNAYEHLLSHRSSKNRVTEVNNSYFEIRQINFSADEIKAKVKELDEILQKTDFEISKLNSVEFEVDI